MQPVEVNRKMHKKRGSARAKAEQIKRKPEKTGENHAGEEDRTRIGRMFTNEVPLEVRLNPADAVLERCGPITTVIA